MTRGPSPLPLPGPVLTTRFCQRWSELLRRLYGYRFEGPFAMVPGMLGRGVLSYLPLLNYADVDLEQARALAERARGRPYQIRVLNPAYRDFRKNETVTMRIDMRGKSLDNVYREIGPRIRRYILEKEREGYVLRVGNGRELVRGFYEVFREIMPRVGTPVFPIRLFELLVEMFEARYYVVFKGDTMTAACVVLYDDTIAWMPWGGPRDAFVEQRPALLINWGAIQEAHAAGKGILDLGRSGYESGTYVFKTRFGAVPTKIDIMMPRAENPYAKYDLISRVWARLPGSIVNVAGPPLCRYLADL
jgi:hypothetical protein